ncbi:BTAD domain-containing putative transcriptional regulator [Kitasatospora sp. NPDC059160]|uniref:AfsR/SARP family transcriptional regulator n=1 Tax=Kitasatospora sp. NPDC059160 TaxID=3346748 RepID=UPI0036B2D1DC
MRFTVLGPLRAWSADRELRINRARDRAVLAVLLAAQGRTVPVGEIVDGVWGEEADGAPDRPAALPGHVYRLRKVLDGAAPDRTGPSVLRHQGKGYRLDVDPGAVDRTAFLAGLADAATARRNWQPERARTLLSGALALWSGPALDDVPGPFAAHERRLLAGRREEALRHCRELDLELSGHPAPTPTPTPPTRAVRRPFQLPPDLPDFTGRRAQLAAVAALLAGPAGRTAPLATVTGPRGAGKSALAVHAAHLAATGYPDGQLYADLHTTGPDAVSDTLAAFVRALGVEDGAVPPGPAERRDLFHRLLAGRRLLVVLDGAAAVAAVRPLLPTAPGCAALVTLDGPGGPGGPGGSDGPGGSAGAAGIEGGGHPVGLGRLSPPEALLLLGRILGPERPAREPEAARALAAACDHLPGPLRRAADRLVRRPAWPISALLPRPEDPRAEPVAPVTASVTAVGCGSGGGR